MIKSFPTPAAYAAAGKPTDETRVAMIQSTGDVCIDGVNVMMDRPTDVCAVFYDADGKDHYVRWNTIQAASLPADWTLVGYSFGFTGKKVKILDKNFPTAAYKWLNCWQYDITAISAATIKFYLHMKGNYAAWTAIEVELSDSSDGYINATTVSEINAALEAAGNTGNVGYDKHGYWAFLDTNKIVVQCDLCEDYRQYQISDGSHALVGCTMALSVWEDMPASSTYFRKSGGTGYGPLNVKKAAEYVGANGATPTANVAINSTSLVNKTSFQTSQYCADLRAYYGTYEAYIAANTPMWPQTSYGVFKLIDADEMTRRYASKTFTKKDGTTVDWKFPALHSALSVGYGSGKYAQGKWHLSDVTDACEYMEDSVLAKLQEAQRRMSTTVITNSVTRWFARRSYAYYAWYFSGTNGNLYTINVLNANRCQAVTLSDFD